MSELKLNYLLPLVADTFCLQIDSTWLYIVKIWMKINWIYSDPETLSRLTAPGTWLEIKLILFFAFSFCKLENVYAVWLYVDWNPNGNIWTVAESMCIIVNRA